MRKSLQDGGPEDEEATGRRPLGGRHERAREEIQYSSGSVRFDLRHSHSFTLEVSY